ncbi:MAG: NAD-dependent epimerase/dehydratase family protein [Bacteroidales bacterium]|nr:NAD-dependent epimerase/dehydratase family protein [Bacteroidales bacterium]
MIKVGITGQSGFVGTHLYNTLGLLPDKFERVLFEDNFFGNETKLKSFVQQCDAIVHLAAMNRHNDPKVIYETNIQLVKQLIKACEETNSTPHILFSSSTQEERDNPYGKSKKEGRKLLENWAMQNHARFTGFIIPNVFGSFGNPYYNSFIATFCHQLTHNEQPKIDTDGTVKLIYVGELVAEIIDQIICMTNEADSDAIVNEIPIKHTSEKKVSEVLELLEGFKANYFKDGIFPNLNNPFERNLFNSFVSYIDHKDFFPFYLKQNTDDRGSFVETVKMNSGGQVSFSTTKPGITRGNHFHTRKAERFAVIKGKARIELRRIGTNEVLSFELDGEKPSFVDMPIWYTHNITNIGDQDLYTIFWISEFFNAEDPDTFFEEV